MVFFLSFFKDGHIFADLILVGDFKDPRVMLCLEMIFAVTGFIVLGVKICENVVFCKILLVQ